MKSTVLLMALSVAAFSVGAQEPPAMQDPIVVTAERWQGQVDSVPAAVTVIDREAIASSQAADMADLLRSVAGIDIVRSGGPGGQTSLFLRGSNSNHTLVLVDGIRVASAHTGGYAWEHLPLDQVERIEIVRGPRASFHGSDAIGGVIHVVTRRSEAPHLHVEYGGEETVRGSAGLSLGDSAARFWASASYWDVGGFSSQNADGFSFHPDDDGYRNRSVTLGFAGAAANQQLQLVGGATDADVEFDQGTSETRRAHAALELTGPLSADWRHALRLTGSDDRLQTPDFFSRFDSERQELDWQLDYLRAADHLLTLGLNLVHEDGRNSDTFSGATIYDRSRSNRALFAGWRWQPGAADLELSLRRDDNSAFGGKTTGQAGLSWPLAQTVQGWASYGTAFRAPALSEQFSPGFGGQFAGNPQLGPETSESLEAGLRYRPLSGHELELRAYATRIDDLIAFAGQEFQAVNIDQASIEGMEMEWRYRGEWWHSAAAVTLQRTEDEAGNDLLRRPEQKLSLRLGRQLGDRTELITEALYVSDRQDFATVLDRYVLVNLRARWSLWRHWQLEGRVENLLDEDYQLAHGFNTQDRTAYLGLRYRP